MISDVSSFCPLRIDAAITVALEFDAAVTLGLEIDAVVMAAAPEIDAAVTVALEFDAAVMVGLIFDLVMQNTPRLMPVFSQNRDAAEGGREQHGCGGQGDGVPPMGAAAVSG